jgi:hypothetical protein
VVNSLYGDARVPQERLLAEICHAGDYYGEGLAEIAVIDRVDALLEAAERGDWRGSAESALREARVAARDARQASLERGSASFYGDLADAALHRTLVAGSGAPETLQSREATLMAFVQDLVSIAVDHLVCRDLTQHLGGPRTRTTEDAQALRDQLVSRAREVAVDASLRPTLRRTASNPVQGWPSLMHEVWQLAATPPKL